MKGYGTDVIQALSNKNTIAQKTAAVNTATNDLETAKKNLVSTKQSYDAKVLQAQQGLQAANNSVTLNTSSYTDTIK